MSSSKINAVLIDDEVQSRQTLRIILDDYCKQVCIIGEAESVLSGYTLLRHVQPDVVFLDVHMADGTGFDLLRKFPNPSFQVIFTTAFDDFAIKAFQVNAIDYLLKPIDIDELLRAVGKIKLNPVNTFDNERLGNLLRYSENESFEKIAIPSSEGLHFIELNEIIRLESDANYTTFHLSSGEKITVARTIKNFDLMLPENDFFRPHQSHIVNLSYVKKMLREDGGYLLLTDNSRVPVTRNKKEEFMEIVKKRYLLRFNKE